MHELTQRCHLLGSRAQVPAGASLAREVLAAGPPTLELAVTHLAVHQTHKDLAL